MMYMRIVSVGLYNPSLFRSADTYIASLLNPLSKNNDLVHYYFVKSENINQYDLRNIKFKTKYLKHTVLHDFLNNNKLVQIIPPDLLMGKKSLQNIVADIVLCDAFTYHAGIYISKRTNIYTRNERVRDVS